jgi:hypothetical protein
MKLTTQRRIQTMNNRKRARYTNNFGPIGFSNPDKSDSFSGASYCIVDNMIHVFMNSSPFENDPRYNKFAEALYLSNRSISRTCGFWHGSLGKEQSLGTHGYLSNWNPGDIDLNDFVEIFEGVPGLNASWMRLQLNELKHASALNPADLDHFDTDRLHWKSKPGLWKYSWLSAKGGTCFFKPETTPQAIDTLTSAFQKAGANTCVTDSINRERGPKIRILWHQPSSNLSGSRENIRSILKTVPGILEARL